MSLEPRARSTIASARLRQLQDYWDRQRAGRVMPARADIDPADIPRLLPNLLLLDVEAVTGRLKVRVVGTTVTEMYGGDYTGRYFDEVDFGDRRAAILHGYAVCIATRQPYVSEQSFWTPLDVTRRVERVILPLSEDGTTVTQLLTGLEYGAVD